MNWFDLYPNLLKQEEDDLIESGYEYEIDKTERKAGKLIIYVNYTIDYEGEKQTHVLRCCYPSSYPYFAVEVYCSTLPMGRHINPVDHRVCLFEDEQNAWNPSSDTLAKVLDSQLPILIERHANKEEPSELEEQVGYQVSGQLNYHVPSVIFVSDHDIPESECCGELTIRVNKNGREFDQNSVYGALESIGYNGKTYDVSSDWYSDYFNKTINARWVRIKDLGRSVTGESLFEKAKEICPSIKNPNYGSYGIDIVGLLIPEESDYRNYIYNWVFIVRKRPPKIKHQKLDPIPVFVRSDRYNFEETFKRIPRLTAYADKRVTLIGVGAIGSQIAWQLSRSGIKSITLVDPDVVQAGNLPRWLYGFSAIGYFKAHIVAKYLTLNSPGTKCIPYALRIGSGQTYNIDGINVDAQQFAERLIEESDIVIDAAAESNVSLYLSELCERQKTTYVWCTGTYGAWGGIVGRVIPDITVGNWQTFSQRYYDGDIQSPPADEGSSIQPVGCFAPTFTGTGFDLDHVALMTVRLVFASLKNTENEGYPNFNWDVGILQLWDEETELPVEPRWKTYTL